MGKKLLRKQPRDAGVLACGKGDTLVCYGFAIPTNHFAHWHDEAHLTLAIRQPYQCSVTMLVCCDITGFVSNVHLDGANKGLKRDFRLPAKICALALDSA